MKTRTTPKTAPVKTAKTDIFIDDDVSISSLVTFFDAVHGDNWRTVGNGTYKEQQS